MDYMEILASCVFGSVNICYNKTQRFIIGQLKTYGKTEKYRGKMFEQYVGYSRKEVHDLIEPTASYKTGTGTWGLQGIIELKNASVKGFVFFVNKDRDLYGDELFSDGKVKWYSQNRTKLTDSVAKKLISHNETKETIFLFWKTKGGTDFYYLGKLNYLEHDNKSEQPIRFYWHIEDFDPDNALDKIPGLEIIDSKSKDVITSSTLTHSSKGVMTEEAAPSYVPSKRGKRKGISPEDFDKGDVDFEGEAKKNSAIGKAGEDRVVEMEKDHLKKAGKADLADKVVATRYTLGNNAPYDVMSYEEDGTEKYIEVKTTTGGKSNKYYISENEVKFSEDNSDKYYLYRLFLFDKRTGTGRYYVKKGAIDRSTLEPTTYKTI